LLRVRTTRLVAIIGLLACVAPATAQGDRGRLRIHEQRTDSGSIPIEGAYQYVAVRRASDDRVVYRDRSSTRLSVSLNLRPGVCRVSSWVRSQRHLTATIHTAFGERCRVTNP
jgi:hypothetical protein